MISKRSNTASAKGRDALCVPVQKVKDMEEVSDNGRLADANGLSPFGSSPAVSPVPASIPSAGKGHCSGEVFVGVMSQALRDGSRNLILCWEADRRPIKVCEGGGWYSAHPTETAWVFRSWMKHKRRPGWQFEKVANESDVHLEDLIERALDRALVRHGFTSAQAIETQRAKTEGLGPKDKSAVAKPCAQGDAT